mgnify:CR=1 FL=1
MHARIRYAQRMLIPDPAGEASTGIAQLLARSMHIRDGLEEQVGGWVGGGGLGTHVISGGWLGSKANDERVVLGTEAQG